MEPNNFEVIALPAENRLDLAVIREVGSVVGSYITRDSAHTFTEALQDALAAPLDPSQTLNMAVGLANAVALVTLAAAADESEAADVIRRTLRQIVPSGANEAAEALISRALVPVDSLPDTIDGDLLISLAEYGDCAVRLTDGLAIPRQTLGPAVSAAAARV